MRTFLIRIRKFLKVVKKALRNEFVVALENRWEDDVIRKRKIIDAIEKNEDWTIFLNDDSGMSHSKLPFQDTTPSIYKLSNGVIRDLRGFNFKGVDFSNSEFLTETCFDYCTFENVHFGNIVGSSFKEAIFNVNCRFDNAKLDNTFFSRADLSGQQFRNATFSNAYLEGTNFENALFMNTTFMNCHFQPNIFARIFWLLLLRKSRATFGGEYQAFLSINTTQKDRDFIHSENRKRRVKKDHPLFGALWWFSDYGRSPFRLIVIISLIIALFGVIYANYPLPKNLETKPIGSFLCYISPRIIWKEEGVRNTHLIPYFASFQTFFSADFSNYIKEPIGWKGQVLIGLETIIGYSALALFISIIIDSSGLFSKDIISIPFALTSTGEVEVIDSIAAKARKRFEKNWEEYYLKILQLIDELPIDQENLQNHIYPSLFGKTEYVIGISDKNNLIIRPKNSKKEKEFLKSEIFQLLDNYYFPSKKKIEEIVVDEKNKMIFALIKALQIENDFD